jgi:PAS domain S-box-containing protein
MLAKGGDGAFIINQKQRIIFWNKAAQELLGFTPAQVIGRTCYELLRGCDDKGRPICGQGCPVINAALHGQAIANYDVAMHTKNGESRWVNVSILTFLFDNTAEQIIIHLFRDATQKKHNEQFIHHFVAAAKELQDDLISLPATPKEPFAETLTDREREVLSLLAQGLSTFGIADTLSISAATARNHVQNILTKLQVHSRLEAVAYALEHGLLNPER